MEEVTLNETESRYFADLFLCCDVEKTGKIPMLKAMELFRSANLSNDKICEIISLSGIPHTALHISRAQFYASLKLIAAHQASLPLRPELIAATVQIPLPRFCWKDNTGLTNVMLFKDTPLTPNIHQANDINILKPPVTNRRNSLPRHNDYHGYISASGSVSRRNSATCAAVQQHQLSSKHDVNSTDSDVEQNELSGFGGDANGSSEKETRRACGSPEAWSTNSDSPTPTNSVAERPWAKETVWHGLLGDEHRQLLGTEEESSDRHSSDEEHDTELESVYQITPEQRDYYYKQFIAVQHNPNGLLSGHVARVFFEKSRIPVEELRHIWQLCDVTRDGALSLAEFTAAMHLVVLRRNNISLPTVLPGCLHPNILEHSSLSSKILVQEPPEADLLHLNDDEDRGNNDDISLAALRMAGERAEKSVMITKSPTPQISANSKQLVVTSSAQSHLTPLVKNRSTSNSPNMDPHDTSSTHVSVNIIVKPKLQQLWDGPSSQWTKFTESPTSNVSSPGPKPANFDMQRTAQAVVSDPQILHPVPLRVTPVAGSISACEREINQDEVEQLSHRTDLVRDTSPRQPNVPNNSTTILHRDLLQNSDLRAIQRPQAKKLPNKNAGALPPPPQRETSTGNVNPSAPSDELPPAAIGIPLATIGINGNKHWVSNKMNPPLPPARPHHHGRSSSLDLNKFKISTPNRHQPEITTQASFDLQTSTGFADFTQFPDDGCLSIHEGSVPKQNMYSLPSRKTVAVASSAYTNAASFNVSTVPSLQFTLHAKQRISAFEVYRKPTTPRNSESPHISQSYSQFQAQPPTIKNCEYVQQQIILLNKFPMHPPSIVPSDKTQFCVNALSETLKNVSFKPNNNICEVLRHLREQNSLLLRICSDLSDELLTVQTQKEEIRLKIEATTAVSNDLNSLESYVSMSSAAGANFSAPRTCSSISAPVMANVTGGSGSSGVQSNV